MCRAVVLAWVGGSRLRFRSTADRVVPSRHIKRNIGELAGDTSNRVRRHGPPLLGLGCPHGGSYISAPSPAYRMDHQFSAFANWHSRALGRNDGGAGNTVAGPIFDLNRTGRFRPKVDVQRWRRRAPTKNSALTTTKPIRRVLIPCGLSLIGAELMYAPTASMIARIITLAFRTRIALFTQETQRLLPNSYTHRPNGKMARQ